MIAGFGSSRPTAPSPLLDWGPMLIDWTYVEISVVSALLGASGFLIMYPAAKKLDRIRGN